VTTWKKRHWFSFLGGFCAAEMAVRVNHFETGYAISFVFFYFMNFLLLLLLEKWFFFFVGCCCCWPRNFLSPFLSSQVLTTDGTCGGGDNKQFTLEEYFFWESFCWFSLLFLGGREFYTSKTWLHYTCPLCCTVYKHGGFFFFPETL
jgi:hypothetical protein